MVNPLVEHLRVACRLETDGALEGRFLVDTEAVKVDGVAAVEQGHVINTLKHKLGTDRACAFERVLDVVVVVEQFNGQTCIALGTVEEEAGIADPAQAAFAAVEHVGRVSPQLAYAAEVPGHPHCTVCAVLLRMLDRATAQAQHQPGPASDHLVVLSAVVTQSARICS